MFKTFIVAMIVIINIFFISSSDAIDQTIKIVTTDEPPLQYKQDGKIIGASYEILQLLLKELGEEDIKIRFYPWARAYNMALKKENVLIFTMFRTVERESLFKWIEPLYHLDMYFYKLKSRKDISVNSLKAAKKYQIGVARSFAAGIYLESKGFQFLQDVSSTELNIKKLQFGRIDMLVDAPIIMKYTCEKYNFDYDLIEPAFKIEAVSRDLYMAFSDETDDIVVERFRGALQKIKKDKAYFEILKRYEINFSK